ncbi:MAG: hypothetical protein K0Q90_349 [Paenibacillaceae bacterium]|jgi:hypothetical protein|nr:hypothetical protein [Paenibacillaceae bacterium]
MSKEAKTSGEVLTFGKEQILSSKGFTALEKDVLQALLAEGQEYTLAQAKSEIEEYVKRRVE